MVPENIKDKLEKYKKENYGKQSLDFSFNGVFLQKPFIGTLFSTLFAQPDSVRDCQEMTSDTFCGLKKAPFLTISCS